jgi:hypothetical protein
MKYIVVILLTLAFLSCKQNQQKVSVQIDTIKLVPNPIDDATIYEFINFVANDKNEKHFVLRGDKVLDKPFLDEDGYLIDSLKKDTIFSKDDIKFLEVQMQSVKNFTINPKLFNGKEIISSDTIKRYATDKERRWTFWEDYRKKYGEAGYCNISLPLFSKDRQKVIICTSYSCGGKCGEGGIFIYQKIKGRWKQIKELSWWII